MSDEKRYTYFGGPHDGDSDAASERAPVSFNVYPHSNLLAGRYEFRDGAFYWREIGRPYDQRTGRTL